MKKWFKILIIIMISALVNAEVTTYRDNHIENNAVSARGLALGMAVTTLVDSSDALLYNPAALAEVKKPRFTLKNDSSLMDVNRISLTSLIPLQDKGVIGFGYTAIGVTGISIAEETATEIREISIASYSEEGWYLGYGYKLTPTLNLGVTYKYYQNKLGVNKDIYDGGNSAYGSDLDIGFTYLWSDEVVVAGGFKNLVSAISSEGVMQWTNGYRESFDFGTYLGISKYMPGRSGIIAADLRFSKLHDIVFGLGYEYLPHDSFAFRIGYNSLNSFSLGLGLNYGGYEIDYAFMPEFGTVLDNKHYISVGYKFGWENKKTREAAEVEKEITEAERYRQLMYERFNRMRIR